MYIFDTDHLSFIQRNGQEGKQILAKLATFQDPEVAVTVITYEEQIRGRLSFLSKAKTVDEQTIAYQGLQQLALDYQSINRNHSFQSRSNSRTLTITQSISSLRKHGLKDCRDRSH
jgi:predicted nucleic acid-binding protein